MARRLSGCTARRSVRGGDELRVVVFPLEQGGDDGDQAMLVRELERVVKIVA